MLSVVLVEGVLEDELISLFKLQQGVFISEQRDLKRTTIQPDSDPKINVMNNPSCSNVNDCNSTIIY